MSKYVPIRVSTLRGDLKIPFNAYVRVAGKYILMCREGDSFEGNRLERLKGKKLQKMYIPVDQNEAYNSYMRENLNRAYDSAKSKPLEIRTQVIHGALQAATEDLIEDPASQAFYNVAVEGARNFAKFFASEPLSLKPMLELKNPDFNVAHHGVVVSSLALALAEELKYNESRPMQMETMSVGCMIHDIEHNYNNVNLTVPPEQLSKPEKVIFDRHAIDGQKRLKEWYYYDPLVLEIVGFHEELINGTGAQKKKEKDLDPLILIAATANAFDHLITYQSLSPREALKKLLIDKMGLLSLECMKALQNALKKRGVI